MPLPNYPILARQLIGRQEHLNALQRILSDVSRHGGRCLLLAGEAGIGKSRLVVEAIRLAQVADFGVVQGNCYEPDHTFPFAPLVDLLGNFAHSRAVDELTEAFGSKAAELARLFTPLKQLTPSTPETLVHDPEQEKRQLFAALSTFLAQLAEAAALLLVIEDVHWCDDTSLEFLLAFYRQLNQYPILLLMTYRADEVTAELRHFLAELDRGRATTELPLTRLNAADTQAMIATIFAQEKPVHSDFVTTIHRLTDGNPFFIEETLKALVTAGDIFQAFGNWTRKPVDALRIPRSVEDAVQRRTQTLGKMAAELLQLAAVVGRRFDFNLLKALTGYDEQALLAFIKEAIVAQLVVEETADRFAFRHALTRQAIYNQLLKREQRLLHQTIAQTLARLAGEGMDIPLGDLAYHFYKAELWEAAIRYGREAGAQAQQFFAPRAAVEQLTRAITAAQHLPRTSSADLYHARGQAYDRLGDFELARADYEEAHRLAQQEKQAPLLWQTLLDLGFLWVGQDYHKAGAYLEQALAQARAMQEPDRLGHTLNRVGNWHLMTEHDDFSVLYHEEALALFETLGDKQGMAHSLDLLGISYFMHGDMITGSAYYERSIALWRELGEKQWLISSLASYATRGGNALFPMAMARLVSLSQAQAEIAEALQLAQALAWPNGEVTALIWQSVLLVPRGELQEALTVAQKSLTMSQELGHNLWMVTALFILGMVYMEVGVWAEAQRYLAEALALAEAAGSVTVMQTMSGTLARIYIAQGNLETAEALLDKVSTPKTPYRMQGHQHVWLARAELMMARQLPSLALPIVTTLLDIQTATDNPPVPHLYWLYGEVLLEMEKMKEAKVALQTARDAAEQLGQRPLAWRATAALARLYHSQQQYRAMKQAMSDCQAIVDAMAGQLQDEALREGFRHMTAAKLPQLRPRTAQKIGRSGGLTRRQREVAILVAQGHTNATIAERLVLSERTIEKHVENIMNKLGFNARAQIAAWVVGQQNTL